MGWFAGFKKRDRIKVRSVSGESESADVLLVESIKNATQPFSMEDVYNYDETSLFFRLEPQKILASKPVKGKKRDKERITVGLCEYHWKRQNFTCADWKIETTSLFWENI